MISREVIFAIFSLAIIFWTVYVFVTINHFFSLIRSLKIIFPDMRRCAKNIYCRIKNYPNEIVEYCERIIVSHPFLCLGICSWITLLSVYSSAIFLEYQSIIAIALELSFLISILWIWRLAQNKNEGIFFFVVSCVLCIFLDMCIKSILPAYSIHMILWVTTLFFIIAIALPDIKDNRTKRLMYFFYKGVAAFLFWFVFLVVTPSDLTIKELWQFIVTFFLHIE